MLNLLCSLVDIVPASQRQRLDSGRAKSAKKRTRYVGLEHMMNTGVLKQLKANISHLLEDFTILCLQTIVVLNENLYHLRCCNQPFNVFESLWGIIIYLNLQSWQIIKIHYLF